ncbi:MAG TPA: apolipoprotein N-acyltransferase [Puia sp.]|nr:apolipoprotein N-acyltransferase [Puia sp.]
MKNVHPFFLSTLSGLLLFAAWPMSPLTFLVFIAFVPLLWMERRGIRRRHFFGWVYVSMLTWNVAATWWVWNATGPGAIAAFLANSLLMCLPWIGFHWVRGRAGNLAGYLSLIAFWLAFEYLHLQDWGLSWPWLTIGNVFAARTGWVQWYEYTGTSGGSLWVLLVNILVFRVCWTTIRERRPAGMTAKWLSAAVFLPIFLSLALKPHREEKMPADNVVIIQPNIDPYEKVSTGSFDAQLSRLIRLSDSAINDSTALLVWPETALYEEHGFEEGRLKQNYFLHPLWDFLRRHPRIDLLTGIESYEIFDRKHSPTAVRVPNTDQYYEGYNAAAIMDSSGPTAYYHKTKLVPGAETLPSYLRFLTPWFEKFGGTDGGYTGQDDRSVLDAPNHSYRIAPAVCYESIYGEFLSRYVRNGADVIVIITNDGWWGNTPGYHQHENYARLRAIETRRWVVRSANTGVSCVIDPAGHILDSRPWATQAFIRLPVPREQRLTFYARYGDWISKVALVLAALSLAYTITIIIKRRKSRG